LFKSELRHGAIARPEDQQAIQNSNLCEKAHIPVRRLSLVCAALRFWSPGKPAEGRRPRHAPSAWRGRCFSVAGKGSVVAGKMLAKIS
jgi:hypothetical protein